MTGAQRRHRGSPGEVVGLVRDGRATSRADLARLTGLAPSTVALRVDELLRLGYLAETGAGASRGGRRPRSLAIATGGRLVAGVEFGARHASVGLVDLAGAAQARTDTEIDITEPPESVLRTIHTAITEQLAERGAGRVLAGIGLAIPGPVDTAGRIVSPSRMPGWNGVDAASVLAGISGVRVRADNDANALALGEHVLSGRQPSDMVVVKTGSSIGSGVITSGRLHRGFRGMAGDISHTAVAGAPQVLCSCGRLGCLDAVAGGSAVVRELRAAGVDVTDTTEVVALASDAHPLATRLLREAGTRTGAVMAVIVNFFNPRRLVLAGSLSAADAFVAGFRSSVYELCLPMTTDGLEIAQTMHGRDLGVAGAAAAVLDDLLDPTSIDRTVADAGGQL